MSAGDSRPVGFPSQEAPTPFVPPDGHLEHIMQRMKSFEQAHDLTVGQLTSRISFLEKRIRDLEAKHGALVQAVYNNEVKRK